MRCVLLGLSVLIQPITSLGLSPITIKGSKFFADGHQFFIKGVAYQPTPSDPLTNATQCHLDAQLMSSIAVNSISVYHVNHRVNHDECMQIFETAGIYLWVGLSTFHNAIPQVDPHWTQEQFLDYVNVVKAFQKYNNLAGFWIESRDINTQKGSLAAPFIKAATADIRTFVHAADYRRIPIGYYAADVAELRPMLQNYLACGSRREQAIEFFGTNNFQWCGLASYAGYSGYKTLQEQAKDYPVPIFFSETGCNTPRPRKFQDQAAIFGKDMSDTWSGAIVYEWSQHVSNYGLVEYPDKRASTGVPKPIQADFDNLANAWASADPSGVQEAKYTPNFIVPPCPKPTDFWSVDGDKPLPTLDQTFVLDMTRKVRQRRDSISEEAIQNSTTLSSSSGPTSSHTNVSIVIPVTTMVLPNPGITKSNTIPQEITVTPITTVIIGGPPTKTSQGTEPQELTITPFTSNIPAPVSTMSITGNTSAPLFPPSMASQSPTTSSSLLTSNGTTSEATPAFVANDGSSVPRSGVISTIGVLMLLFICLLVGW